MPQSKIVELLKVSREYWGIDARRYRQLADEGRVPKPEKGKIDFFASTKALFAYERSLRHTNGGSEQKEAQTRRDVAKAEREELIVKKLKGELVPHDQAKSWLTLAVSNARLAFQALPRRMAGILALINDPRDIEFELYKAIREILNELAKEIKKKRK